MSDLNEIECGQLCQTTIESLYDASGGLSIFPRLLKKVIVTEAWKRRVSKGRVIELDSLRKLITEKPIRGWGEDPRKVEALIKDEPEVLAMYREAMKGKPGRPPKEHDKNSSNTTGFTTEDRGKAYTLSRLQRESPELFQQVCDGELSANAAAIQAGFRKKPSPEELAVRHFRKAENKLQTLKLMVEALDDHERQAVAVLIKELTK